MFYQRVLSEFPSTDIEERSWSFTVFTVACLINICMLYLTGHFHESNSRNNSSNGYDNGYDDFDYEDFDREDSSYGNRVDDYYANALEQLYDHFGI